jgi:hypothetical protein
MLDSQPASYITSFYLPAAQMEFANRLVAAFPNLTVIDVAAVIGQIQGMVEQLIGAVQFVFGFAVVAGVVVLLGALQATHDEREKELAILRTLGARNRQLRGRCWPSSRPSGWWPGRWPGSGRPASAGRWGTSCSSCPTRPACCRCWPVRLPVAWW